jgi:DNA polymerase (family 10)
MARAPHRKAAPAVSNAEVARALREMALFLEMDEVPFKPRAYEKAALAVDALDRPLREIDAEGGLEGLEALPGVGKGIAKKIHARLRTGRIPDLERLRKKTPVDVVGLTAVEGLGPKGAKLLYEELGVRDVRGLEKACREERVRALPHFGAKSEEKILRGIGLLAGTAGRQLLGLVLPLARDIEARLRDLSGVRRAELAGSVRRRKETIGDLDFLVSARDASRVGRAFAAMPEVVHVYGRGETKTLVRLGNGMDADLRVVSDASFGAALCYFTGSKAHNVALRRIAQARGLKLNEYGLYRDRRKLAGRTEEEIYEALGLDWIPPELREDAGEIEAAGKGGLPALIEHGDLRGDLQIQTDWTDGSASIEEMADAARKLGLEYIAITDHTRDLAMARGSDEKRLLEQAEAIHELNEKLRGFRVLSGAEVNIRKDGSLDVADAALAKLDVVGAAVHAQFHQGREEMTRRVIRAMENPHVDILFHPTARSIGHREPVDLDIDAVIAAAVRTGTVLEIDAMPDRLDLRDEYVRKAVDAGALLAIDSDAHQPGHLAYADELGVAVARRGWARKADVVNAFPVARCLARLKGGRTRREGRRTKRGGRARR